MTEKYTLVERLRRKSFERMEMHDNYGYVGVPCDHDEDGAEAYLVNPDGPEAADTIERLTEALEKSVVALDEAAKLLAGKGLQGCGSIMATHAEIARAALSPAALGQGEG